MAELVQTPRGAFLVDACGPAGGVPVVFVAGLGDDHASWDAPVDILSRRLRCVTFDNRGIGASPITPGPYSTREMAEDAEAVVAALGLEQVDVAGSSMGGAICQEWALRHPARIRRMVLSNTWADQDAWFSALIEHWVDLAGRGNGADVLYQLALFCYSPDYLAAHPDTIEEFVSGSLPDLTGFTAAGRACQGHDASSRLAEIRHEVLVIGGKADILTRPELSERLAKALPSARLEWLAAGHMIFWERPGEWADLVDRFLG
ncbi:alpha/beta fold hydrolase [Pseudonocardia sp.]|uniref:alpha/beta fold hydrolase n=1 Tax=Pseudonocardia sp. TaxID=60912 RepID=UPI003D0B747F